MAIATKASELTANSTGKGEVSRRNRRKRTRKGRMRDGRAPRGKKRLKDKARARTKFRESRRRRKRRPLLRRGISPFIKRDSAVRRDPNKGKRNRGGERMNERPDRMKSRREKNRRTSLERAQKGERVTEKRRRGKTAGREMRAAFLESQLERHRFSRVTRAVRTSRLSQTAGKTTKRAGNNSTRSTSAQR